jgi:hypothetical protein
MVLQVLKNQLSELAIPQGISNSGSYMDLPRIHACYTVCSFAIVFATKRDEFAVSSDRPIRFLLHAPRLLGL